MQEVGLLLRKFLQEKYPQPGERKISISLLRENWLAKLVTFFLAIGLWYVLVPGSSTVEATYKLPVQVENLPPDFSVEDIQPPEVTLTFTGPKRTFYFFDPARLKVSIDLSTMPKRAQDLAASEQNIRHPHNLTLQQLNPTTIRISLGKISREPEATKANAASNDRRLVKYR